jgi:hypothetical protein
MASFQQAQNALDTAIARVFDADRRVQAVGIGREDGDYVIRAIRNNQKIMPLSAPMQSINQVDGVRVAYVNAPNDVVPATRVPASGPGSPSASSLVPEQGFHRDLCCGLQLQNFDDDIRQGHTSFIIVGTLGCFVNLPGGQKAILSNNHVLAAENSGVKGGDRILQPGTLSTGSVPNEHVAFLTDFVDLKPSPIGASPATGTVLFNAADVAVAELNAGMRFNQGYLPFRGLPTVSGKSSVSHGDRVYKVGRTTGLTRGEITSVSVVVGPVPYRPGQCWFERSLEIEGVSGTMFSDHGDSGSAIVREDTNEVVGLLYAGNGVQTYACPIDDCLNPFGGTIA